MSASHGMRSIIETKKERLNLSEMPLFLKALRNTYFYAFSSVFSASQRF